MRNDFQMTAVGEWGQSYKALFLIILTSAAEMWQNFDGQYQLPM